jgi:hypothetical protein
MAHDSMKNNTLLKTAFFSCIFRRVGNRQLREDIMGESSQYGGPDITRVKDANAQEMTFDGKKADLYLNTGRLGGQHYLVQVVGAEGRPTLIAIHL